MAHKKPIVLLIHGGGFTEGDKITNDAVRAARAAGLKPVQVNYTLGNISKAVKEVKQIARHKRHKGHKVFAYGESAGATLAALLADKGLVKRSVAYAPPTDLTHLGRLEPTVAGMIRSAGSHKTRRRASPFYKRSKRPILAQISRWDPYIPKSQTKRWVANDPRVRSQMINSHHGIMPPDVRAAQLRKAMAYLSKRKR